MTDTSLLEKTFELILSPHKSGAYLSKPDMSKLAISIGFSIIIQERKRMIDELFKSVKTADEVDLLFCGLIAFYDSKKCDYESVFGFFPATNECLLENYNNCVAAIQKLKDLQEEARMLSLTPVFN